MLAVGLDRPGVEDLLNVVRIPVQAGPDRAVMAEIACENSPASTVLCGRETEPGPIIEELERRNVQHQLLPGNIAFHSRAMEPIRDKS